MPEIVNIIAILVGLIAGSIQLVSGVRKWYLSRKNRTPIDESTQNILKTFIDKSNSINQVQLDKNKITSQGTVEHTMLSRLDSVSEYHREDALNCSAYKMLFHLWVAMLFCLFSVGLGFWMQKNLVLLPLNMAVIFWALVELFVISIAIQFLSGFLGIVKFRYYLYKSGAKFERVLVVRNIEPTKNKVKKLIWKKEFPVEGNIGRLSATILWLLIFIYFAFSTPQPGITISEKFGQSIGFFLPWVVIIFLIGWFFDFLKFLYVTRKREKIIPITGVKDKIPDKAK